MSNQHPTERWVPIPGYEGFYEVSNIGHVRSIDRAVPRGNHTLSLTGVELVQYIDDDGRHWVNLTRDSRGHSTKVHHLVLEAFVGSAPEGLMGCHNDGNTHNNTLGNLRWDTQSNNSFDSIVHGTHFNASKTHCKNGHEFTAENTYLTKRGRACRPCHLIRMRAYDARRSPRLRNRKAVSA